MLDVLSPLTPDPLLQQMHLIHKGRFTPQEIETYRQLVFNNVTHGLRIVLEALDGLDLEIDPELQVHDLVPPFSRPQRSLIFQNTGICGHGTRRARSTRWGAVPN